MKKIDFITYTTVNAQQPLRSDSLDFLENGNIEVFNSLVLSRIRGSYTTNTVVILYGCINTGTYPTYTISAGAIYFNGIVYLVPAFSGGSGSNVAIADLVTTQPSFAASGTKFTNGVFYPVHNDTTAIISAGTGSRPVTGTVLPDYSTWGRIDVRQIDSVTSGSISSTETIVHSLIANTNNVKSLKVDYNGSWADVSNHEIVIKLYAGGTVSGHTAGSIGGTISGGTLLKTVVFNLGVAGMLNAVSSLTFLFDYTGGQSITITATSSSGGTPSVQNNSDLIIS